MISDFIFDDHVDLSKLNKSKLVLYDHNIPEGKWIQYKENVIQIIDHHEDKTIGYYS
jgi:inorganic pyrophosphatase/exopolyphosphatase